MCLVSVEWSEHLTVFPLLSSLSVSAPELLPTSHSDISCGSLMAGNGLERVGSQGLG